MTLKDLKDITSTISNIEVDFAFLEDKIIPVYRSPVKSMRCPKCKMFSILPFSLVTNDHNRDITFGMCGNCHISPSGLQNLKGATLGLINRNKATESPKIALFNETHQIPDSYRKVSLENLDEKMQAYFYNLLHKRSGNVFLTGKPGTGKTYSAIAFCHAYTSVSISTSYFTFNSLQHLYYEKSKEGGFFDFKRALIDRDCLVIDEIGNYEPFPEFIDYFHQLLDQRMNNKKQVTILISNSYEETCNIFKDAISNRLNAFELVEFDKESYR